MIRRALPERVLARGGRVGGILYFEVVGRGDRPVPLEAELGDADSDQRVGVVTIPFVGGN